MLFSSLGSIINTNAYLDLHLMVEIYQTISKQIMIVLVTILYYFFVLLIDLNYLVPYITPPNNYVFSSTYTNHIFSKNHQTYLKILSEYQKT